MHNTEKPQDKPKNSGKLGKVLALISQIPEKALLIIMIITLTDMLWSVITRYLIGQAVFWAEEVGTFGLVWMTMIGAGVAVKRGVHFTMPTFVERLSPKIRFVIVLINHGLVITFGVLLIFTGAKLVQVSSTMQSPALEINLGIINSAAIVGGALILIYEGRRVIDLIAVGRFSSLE